MDKETLCLLKADADEGLLGLFDIALSQSDEIAKELNEEIKIRKDELARLKKAYTVYRGFAKEKILTPEDRGNALLETAKKLNNGRLLEEAYALGVTEARLEYASALINGTYNVPVNLQEGLAIYQEEADKGNALACFAITDFHKDHPDLVDPEMAYQYCAKAAKLGYEPAKERLKQPFDESPETTALKKRLSAGEKGVAYLLSLRQDIPLKRREVYLMKALEEGDGRAEYDVGKGLLDAKQKKLARPYFERAIEHGNGQACFGLAKCILHGLPHYYRSGGLPEKIAPEHLQELELMKKAAELGDIRGLCVMGRTYARGYLVDKDEAKAKELLDKAYEAGERFDSPRLIGELYRYRKEPGSAETAVEYYKIAADHGNQSAMLGLMDIYEKGLREIKPDASKAAYYRYLAGIDHF